MQGYRYRVQLIQGTIPECQTSVRSTATMLRTSSHCLFLQLCSLLLISSPCHSQGEYIGRMALALSVIRNTVHVAHILRSECWMYPDTRSQPYEGQYYLHS